MEERAWGRWPDSYHAASTPTREGDEGRPSRRPRPSPVGHCHPQGHLGASLSEPAQQLGSVVRRGRRRGGRGRPEPQPHRLHCPYRAVEGPGLAESTRSQRRPGERRTALWVRQGCGNHLRVQDPSCPARRRVGRGDCKVQVADRAKGLSLREAAAAALSPAPQCGGA